MQLFKKSFFIIPVFLFYWIGGLGLNYGPFWTERDFIYEPLHKMVRSGVLLPGYYIYPSFYHWPCLGWLGIKALSYPQELSQAGKVSVPDQVGKLPQISTAEDISPFQDRLHAIIESPGYQIGVRWIFLGIAGLSIIWIYALVYSVTSSREAGWLAQGLLLGSWHFMFHSRWVGVDAGVASFGTLVIWTGYMALAGSAERDRKKWLWASSCAAGLAVGCKYPGGIFSLAPLFVVGCGFPQWSWRDRILQALVVCTLFAGVFVVTTPAVILDAGRFWRQVIYVQHIYSGSGWGAQTVDSYSEHLVRLFEYLIFIQMAPSEWISCILFSAALCGFYTLWKRNLLACYFLMIPITYVAYFAQQKTFIVRNYLLLFPFLILMVSCGFLFFYQNLLKYFSGARWLVLLVVVMVACLVYYNLRVAQLTCSNENDQMLKDFSSYFQRNSSEVCVSEKLRQKLGWDYDCSRGEIVGKKKAVLLSEVANCLPANSFQYIDRQFGACEIDLRYYPVWNKEAILLLSKKGTEELEKTTE